MTEILYLVIPVILLHGDKCVLSVRKLADAEQRFLIRLHLDVLLLAVIQYANDRGIQGGGKRGIDATQLLQREGDVLLTVAADCQVDGYGHECLGLALDGNGQFIAFCDIFVNKNLRVAVHELCHLFFLGQVIDREVHVEQVAGQGNGIVDGERRGIGRLQPYDFYLLVIGKTILISILYGVAIGAYCDGCRHVEHRYVVFSILVSCRLLYRCVFPVDGLQHFHLGVLQTESVSTYYKSFDIAGCEVLQSFINGFFGSFHRIIPHLWNNILPCQFV